MKSWFYKILFVLFAVVLVASISTTANAEGAECRVQYNVPMYAAAPATAWDHPVQIGTIWPGTYEILASVNNQWFKVYRVYTDATVTVWVRSSHCVRIMSTLKYPPTALP